MKSGNYGVATLRRAARMARARAGSSTGPFSRAARRRNAAARWANDRGSNAGSSGPSGAKLPSGNNAGHANPLTCAGMVL